MAHVKLRPDIRALTEKWRKIYGTGLSAARELFEGFAISNIRSALLPEFFWTRKKENIIVLQ